MTTVVVVKKAGQIAIAADTLVTFGDTRLAHRFEDNTKIFKVETTAGPSYIGMAGTVAHFPVLRKAMGSMPREIQQAGQQGRGLRHLHQAAPVPEGQLLPADQGRRQRPLRVQPVQRGDRQRQRHLRPVQLPRGVRVQGVLGHRLGPQLRAGRDARRYWDKAKTAREVAEAGIAAGCEFDRNSACPSTCSPSKLKGSK
jgi:ATP-dependent HslUV protease subunit HslV